MPLTEGQKRLSNFRGARQVMMVTVLEGQGTEEEPYAETHYIIDHDGTIRGRVDQNWKISFTKL